MIIIPIDKATIKKNPNAGSTQSHVFGVPNLFKILPGQWEMESDNNIETIYHLPIGEYSYEYENTPIECNECKNLIPFKEIEHDWEDNDVEFEFCPICKEIDTFEYEFQSIEEALKP